MALSEVKLQASCELQSVYETPLFIGILLFVVMEAVHIESVEDHVRLF